jgi:nucleoside-diphosphate kinase
MTESAPPQAIGCAAARIPAQRAATAPLPALEHFDWSLWSVVLLKPDCIERGLCEPVLDHISHELTVVDHRHLTPTWEQISAHYDDMLEGPRAATITWCDMETELRSRYVGAAAGFALVHGSDAPGRMRTMLGHFDPAKAAPNSLRGLFGIDSAEQAVREGRMTRNVIHSSDDEKGALKEFRLWYGEANAHLLTTRM